MKDKSILSCLGFLIYIVISSIDRFIYHISNVIYIPIAILSTVLVFIGIYKDKAKA